MYRALIIMAFILLSLTTRAQNIHVKDSLHMALNKDLTDTGRVHTLIELANVYSDDAYTNSSVDSASFYLRQARKLNKVQYGVYFQHLISILSARFYCKLNPDRDFSPLFLPIVADCRKTGDKKNEFEAWFELANYTIADERSNPFRLSCFEHALLLCRELKDPAEIACIRQIANIHLQQHKYDLAESELLQILNAHKRVNPEDLLYSSDALTDLYISKAEYGKALLYGMRTIDLMHVTKDSLDAITFYGRLTYLHYILGNYPLSMYWAKMYLNNAIVTNRLAAVYSACMYVANCLLREKKAQEALKFILDIQARYKPLNNGDRLALDRILGDCYYALKKYDVAEKSYLEMISIDPGKMEGNQYASTKASALSTMASFCIQNRQYKKAKMYLLEALKYDKVVGQVGFLENTHLSLFRADSALGNYQSAIIHLQESNRLKDSMFTIAKNKQIEELDISYQTAEKEKSLKLVQNKERLEQVKLQHTETTRNWIIAGSGLLLIIAGLLFRQSRLRRKNNKLITHKNKVITHKNELLQSLVTEKEWLLKEVHHRVKNNLHTVICLLESQAAYLEDDALLAIEKSQHRIYTMSLIHQKLYQSDDVKTIDMSVYIPELVQYLEDSFDVSSQIHFNLMIGSIQLSPSQAIPLALLINEAVTNAIKYAFPDSKKGEITISLTDTGAHYKLEITDNGIGMSEKEKREANSLGLDLMKGLSKEIMGNINIENKDGVKITVLFEHDILNDMDISEVDYLTSQSGEINL